MKVAENNEVFITTNYHPRIGYLVPSILFGGNFSNEKMKKACDKFHEGGFKDILLNDGDIPANFDIPVENYITNPVTRLSKNVFKRDENVIARYKNDKGLDREFVYVIGQIHGTKGSYSESYDFVESGFFDEEPWLNEDFQADLEKFKTTMDNLKNVKYEDDEVLDNLRNWVSTAYSERNTEGTQQFIFLPGIAMYDNSCIETVRSFFFTNHPGEKDKPFIVYPNDIDDDGEYEEEKVAKYFESIWKYKYCFQGGKWGNWLNVGSASDKHYHIFHKTKIGQVYPDFMLLSPRSEGYISYINGDIKISLYKEIVSAVKAIPYSLDDLISKARLIIFDELNWAKNEIDGLKEDESTVKYITEIKGYQTMLEEILLLLEYFEGKSIFDSPEDTRIIPILRNNEWAFNYLVRDMYTVPVPDVAKDYISAYSSNGEIIPTSPYAPNSIYLTFFDELKLNWIVSPSHLVFTPKAGHEEEQFNSLKRRDGYLYKPFKICPLMCNGVDLTLIENLPNVTWKNFRQGLYVYREQYYLGDGRWIGRDIWMEDKITSDIKFVLFGCNGALGEATDEDEEEPVHWNSTSLNSLQNLLESGEIQLKNLPDDVKNKIKIN